MKWGGSFWHHDIRDAKAGWGTIHRTFQRSVPLWFRWFRPDGRLTNNGPKSDAAFRIVKGFLKKWLRPNTLWHVQLRTTPYNAARFGTTWRIMHTAGHDSHHALDGCFSTCLGTMLILEPFFECQKVLRSMLDHCPVQNWHFKPFQTWPLDNTVALSTCELLEIMKSNNPLMVDHLIKAQTYLHWWLWRVPFKCSDSFNCCHSGIRPILV